MPSREPNPPVVRSTRTELATAAGVSVAAASIVGAIAAAGRALSGKDARPSARSARTERSSSEPDRRSGGTGAGPSANDDSAGSARQRAATAPDPDASYKPEGPEDLHKPTFFYSLKKTAREFGSDQCTDIAASLVYYAVLALGPGIIAIVSILGLLSPTTISDLIKTVINPALSGSPSTLSLVTGLLTNASKAPGAGLGLIVGLAGALWSASGYVGAFSRAMNRIYSIPEGRPVWKLRPTQLAITLAVVILVVIGALLLVSAGPIVEQVANVIGLGPVALTIFQIVKWPLLVVIAIAAIAILYYFAPNIRQPKFKWTSTGSILALIVLAVATAALGLYLTLTQGGSYSKSYGPIAGVVIFLLWLWLTNLALLFGAEFDAELERSRELQAGIRAEEQIQLPPRDTRQSDKKAATHEKDVEQARRLRSSRGRSD